MYTQQIFGLSQKIQISNIPTWSHDPHTYIHTQCNPSSIRIFDVKSDTDYMYKVKEKSFLNRICTILSIPHSKQRCHSVDSRLAFNASYFFFGKCFSALILNLFGVVCWLKCSQQINLLHRNRNQVNQFSFNFTTVKKREEEKNWLCCHQMLVFTTWISLPVACSMSFGAGFYQLEMNKARGLCNLFCFDTIHHAYAEKKTLIFRTNEIDTLAGLGLSSFVFRCETDKNIVVVANTILNFG